MLQANTEMLLSDSAILERARDSGRTIRQEVLLALEQGEMPLRYQRNGQCLSPADQATLARAHVVLAGCGGLGGHVLESLVRSGVGRITACDPDIFEPSNANRQPLASTRTMGRFKAQAAQFRAGEINPLVEVSAVTKEVSLDHLFGAQVVADCLGGTLHRKALQATAAEAGLPMVSAAVSGWKVLVSSTWPGEPGLSEFMSSGRGPSREQLQGNPCPTVALAASLQATELIHILLGIPSALRGNLLTADLIEMRFSTISLHTRGD
ncbi:HesA/MoeB/ThiF family protein [Desulfonatronum thioautotrophicum]|uniref:HesA/MoeB/ThiF family protein n=1 Tax=Desulfonatronum thioautotrophicum TaxID=617001 RepID=UPI0005EAF11C|nr:HesA/MoeB/ThiF family protein [Desulfonatronum thioautotrophicum]